MIASIQKFFNQFIAPEAGQHTPAGEKALQVATAALLLEMMRMDNRFAEEERHSVEQTLQKQFALDAGQLAELIELAKEEASQATGYHQFTSLINQHCDLEQKVQIVENLWHVAMADGHIDAHESHLMRKIGDLLHVGHANYIAAKQRARVRAGLPAD
ncbi:MAG: TerB family tellurite resistance protein [Zoogloeaceae bacterium]|nr:TerB family tellurite resistance protein [Zoogloeaceae bacterium]